MSFDETLQWETRSNAFTHSQCGCNFHENPLHAFQHLGMVTARDEKYAKRHLTQFYLFSVCFGQDKSLPIVWTKNSSNPCGRILAMKRRIRSMHSNALKLLNILEECVWLKNIRPGKFFGTMNECCTGKRNAATMSNWILYMCEQKSVVYGRRRTKRFECDFFFFQWKSCYMIWNGRFQLKP